MKLLKHVIITVLLLSLAAACSVNEENFPVNLEEVLNNNGAYLRVNSVEVAGFDILDLENSAYIFSGEVFDREEGELLESVEFYVSYESADGTVIEETSDPIKVYEASEFERGGINDLPQNQFEIAIDEATAPLGLTTDDLAIGDVFFLRWEVNLTDGRTFTAEDASSPITGGAFFSSPYRANVGVVGAIPEDVFVGSYTFTQESSSSTSEGVGGTGAVFEGSLEFTVDVSVNPNNNLTGRVFNAAPYAEFGASSQDVEFSILLAEDTADNSVTLSSNVDVGLGCGGGGLIVGPGSEDNPGDFDLDDDSEFTLVVQDNVAADCGAQPQDITFTVTKN